MFNKRKGEEKIFMNIISEDLILISLSVLVLRFRMKSFRRPF